MGAPLRGSACGAAQAVTWCSCLSGQALGYRAGVRLKHLALGQGMGGRAAEAVEAGAARGLWVLLQNCHLLPRWLPALDALLERLDRPHKA